MTLATPQQCGRQVEKLHTLLWQALFTLHEAPAAAPAWVEHTNALCPETFAVSEQVVGGAQLASAQQVSSQTLPEQSPERQSPGALQAAPAAAAPGEGRLTWAAVTQ